jgi:hypothetical protein
LERRSKFIEHQVLNSGGNEEYYLLGLCCIVW